MPSVSSPSVATQQQTLPPDPSKGVTLRCLRVGTVSVSMALCDIPVRLNPALNDFTAWKNPSGSVRRAAQIRNGAFCRQTSREQHHNMLALLTDAR